MRTIQSNSCPPCPTNASFSLKKSPRLSNGGRYKPVHCFENDTHDLSKCPRFARVKRPYTAADVVAKRGTISIQYPSNIQGQKLWRLLSEHAERKTVSHTYGA